MDVFVMDYKTLDFDTYLNDNIIDFKLLYLMQHMSEELKKEIYIFPTQFYKRLCNDQMSINQEEGLTQSEQIYLRVRNWTKKVDIFSKKMLFVPVCNRAHWFLLVILKPGCLTDKNNQKNTAIIVLDSMAADRGEEINNVKYYLKEELWKKKEVAIVTKDIPIVSPKPPQQDDFSSCGVYLLHYAEMIISRLQFYEKVESYNDLSGWETNHGIKRKRKDIADLLLKMSREQDYLDKLEIPQLYFEGAVRVEQEHYKNYTELSTRPVLSNPYLDYVKMLNDRQGDFTLVRKYKA